MLQLSGNTINLLHIAIIGPLFYALGTNNYPEKYKHYLTYRDFKNKYGLGHNESQLLLGGKHSKGMGESFSLGTFEVTQYSKACKYADHILSMKEFYTGWKRRSFVACYFFR